MGGRGITGGRCREQHILYGCSKDKGASNAIVCLSGPCVGGRGVAGDN